MPTETSTSTTPRVSVLIPARNEARYVESCVRSVLAQDVDGGLEVLVVDGDSTDGTAELARRAGAAVLDNPERTIPAALNRGLAAARGEVLVRFDAHAEMPPGYIASCVRALDEEPEAGSVGGWREARGTGPWGRALGAALASPFGVGHADFWRRPSTHEARRDVEHVPLGCFRTTFLRQVDGWREDLLANEDYELDYRLRLAGRRIVFDPAVWSVYRPRESLAAIARQYRRYGHWKAVMLTTAPRSLRPRQLAPPALAAAVVLAAVPSPLAWPARGALGAYALLLASVAARSEAGWRTGPTLAAMHLAWASGLCEGFFRLGLRRVFGA